MGKASRWLVNFLLGRKEDNKGKRKHISNTSISYEEEEEGCVMSTPYGTPLIVSKAPFKRRWSFGKLGNNNNNNKERSSAAAAHHKSSRTRSLDSITATPLVKQAVLSLENNNVSHGGNYGNMNTRVLAMGIINKTRRTPTYNYAVESEAATRIQATFRSYLAKKALHALRGLVKLQALVRGHLVRKQTTDTLRRMHALMAIQVRARFQRIQMAEEPQPPSKHGRFPQEMRSKRGHGEAADINLYENHGIIENRNGFVNHTQIERFEQGITKYYSGELKYYSGELKISKRKQKYEEFSFTTHNSPRQSPPMMKTTTPTPGRSSFSTHDCHHPYDPYMPSYMANTESSRARVRSQSEPKQRPTTTSNNVRAKGQRTAEEMDGDSIQQNCCSSQSNGVVADENKEPWFVKVYRSTRTGKENEGNTSCPTSYSEYRKSLVTSEPHATLF